MPSCDYLQQFQLALSIFHQLKQLWEPPITPVEECIIFLHSFPHDMVQTFRNVFNISFTPPDLTLDNIANGMEHILSIAKRKQPHQATTYYGPPCSIHRPNPQDYSTDEQKPLLPIGPYSCAGHLMDPIYLGGIPACLESSLTNLSTFTPDLSNSIHNCNIQAYLYWTKLPPSQQPPASLMFWHFNHFLLYKLQTPSPQPGQCKSP